MSEFGVRGLAVRTLSLLLGAGALIGFGGGCFITNTAHCGYHEDGADNPCPAGYVCSVCAAENNGCVPIEQMDNIAKSCLESHASTTGVASQTDTVDPTVDPTVTPPTDTGMVTETTTTTTGVGPTSTTETSGTSTETSTTEAPGTTAMADCDPNVSLVDEDCGDQYCVGVDQCGFCPSFPADKSCSDVDAGTPACDPVSGKCVECTAEDASACSGNTPVCVGNECAPCTEHDQCATACDIETGACFPDDPESIIFVQNTGVCNAQPAGTMDDPFCKFTSVPLVEGKPTTIMVVPGDTAMPPLAIPTGNYVIAVRAFNPLQQPVLDGTNNGMPTIQVSSQNRVYLWNLKFNKSGSPAILRCSKTLQAEPGGTLYIDDTRILGNGFNTAKALEGTDCKIRMRRTRVWRTGAGVQVTNGSLRVDASSFTDNGIAGESVFGAFNFLSPGEVVISYSTFVDHPKTKSSSMFNCGGNMPPGGVQLRNSVVLNVDPLDVPLCNGWVTNTGSMMQGGATIADLGPFKTLWLSGPVEGLYKAKKDGSLKDVATWAEGDPVRDIDGAAIPRDVSSYAGCDQPPL